MKIPLDQIKDYAVIADNTLVTVCVDSFEIGQTRGGPKAKLPAGCKQYDVQLRVTEAPNPGDVDLVLFDHFTVGTEEDPEATDPATWLSNKAVGARRVKEFMNAIGVMSNDDEDWVKEAPDQQCHALVIIETYDERERNKIKYPGGYFPIGGGPVRQTGKAAAKPTAARPATPTQVQAPTAVQPRAASVAPARRVAQPPAPAGPNGPAATATAAQRPSAAKPATVSKGAQAIPCVLCQDAGEADFMIPRAEFQGHYAQHLAQQTSDEE